MFIIHNMAWPEHKKEKNIKEVGEFLKKENHTYFWQTDFQFLMN